MDRIKSYSKLAEMKPHPANPVHPVKTPWPKVRLGEVLRQKEQRIAEIMDDIRNLLDT